MAEAASERYGWPLEIVEEAGDDPPLEQPQAFLRALRPALAPFVDSVDADGLYDVGENHIYVKPIEERRE